jgi:hypothetical protein
MPDNIRIDSFPGFAHMHIHRKHPHLTIDVQDAEKVYNIVTKHMERNGKVEAEKLVEELGQEMRVTLRRKTTGREIVARLQRIYGSRERLYKCKEGNMQIYTDLNDYTYYTRNPEEVVEETKTLFMEKSWLDALELELLDRIKHQESLEELEGRMDGDEELYQKLEDLKLKGLITFRGVS